MDRSQVSVAAFQPTREGWIIVLLPLKNSLTLTLSNLTLGEHTIELWLFDVYENNFSDSLMITVIDDIDPIIEAQLSSLSFEDGIADKLICCNALHVMDDPLKALNEMKRVLKSDGMLIIPTYCHKEGKSVSSRLLRTVIRFANSIGVIPSLHIWKKEDLISVIESSGFRVECSERIAYAKMYCCYVCATNNDRI